MKGIDTLFIFVLVCRIFSWGPEGPNGVIPEINKWLQGKTIIRTEQTSIGYGGRDSREQTYLTIIAEDNS